MVRKFVIECKFGGNLSYEFIKNGVKIKQIILYKKTIKTI